MSKSLEEHAKLRESKASPLAKRRTAKPATKKRATACAEVSTGGIWTATPPIAHAGRSLDVPRRKVGGVAVGAKSCKNPRSETELSHCSWVVHQVCAEAHAFLVEDVEIDGAQVAYSNGCSLQGVPHHHGSQVLAAVMDRWPSFSRFGSRKLPRNLPHRRQRSLSSSW